MTSNRKKMYETNAKARAWFEKNEYTDVHFFPHTRFSKDAYFKGLGWDGIATLRDRIVLFQTKTNRGCTENTKKQMMLASAGSGAILIWINAVTRKGLDITIISPNQYDILGVSCEQLNSKEVKHDKT